MDCKITNQSNGRSGGVMTLWKKEIKGEHIYSTPKYIDVGNRGEHSKSMETN
jgi:hypothetical protein